MREYSMVDRNQANDDKYTKQSNHQMASIFDQPTTNHEIHQEAPNLKLTNIIKVSWLYSVPGSRL